MTKSFNISSYKVVPTIIGTCLIIILIYQYGNNRESMSQKHVLNMTNIDIPSYLEGIPSCDMSWTHHSLVNKSGSSVHCEVSNYVQRLPCAVLIGERKTGTTAIVTFLQLASPHIRVAHSEPHFFESEEVFSQDRFTDYLHKMPLSCPGEVTMEKTPAYFRLPFVTERMYKWNPHIKLLLSLRDPVQRAVSDFYFELRGLDYEVEILGRTRLGQHPHRVCSDDRPTSACLVESVDN